MTPLEREALRAFRQHVYRTFGSRRDALFELLDAIRTAPTIEPPAHLRLTATCQRGWGSRYAARNVGTLDLPALERLVASYPLASARAMPVMPVSGRAATPKRAPSAATLPIPTGTPLGNPSWPAGTLPGWCRCPAAVRVGRRPGGCGGCGPGRTPIRWPPNRSAPGGVRRHSRPRPPSASMPATTPSRSASPWRTNRSA